MIAKSDAKRELTVRGRKEVQNKIDCIDQAGPDRIISSPFLRARQTADILASDSSSLLEVEVWEELTPDGEPSVIVEKMSGLDVDTILLTSHQPLVGRLVKYLADEDLPFDTAQICCVTGSEIEKHCCRVKWTG